MASIIFQIHYQLKPGREQSSMYFCFGNDPKVFDGQKLKKNYPIIVLICLWFALHICCLLKIQIYKFNDPIATLNNESMSPFALVFDHIIKPSLASMLTFTFCLLLFVAGISLIDYIRRLDIAALNTSPNYQLYFFSHHVMPLLVLAVFIAFYFKQHLILRNSILEEVNCLKQNCKESIVIFFRNRKIQPVNNIEIYTIEIWV